MIADAIATPKTFMRGIVEKDERGTLVVSPGKGRPFRRMIYLDNYGGRTLWSRIHNGKMPPHHLRGCLELVRMGYEVALAEPLPDFYFNRNAVPHDLRLLGLIRNWLGPDGIIFCGHNVLFWTLFLKKLGLVKCRIVSNLWAREPLHFATAHSAIVCLTGAAVEQAAILAPKVKAAGLGWGVDLNEFPDLPYRPEVFFSCGRTLRDFKTLSAAAAKCGQPIEIMCPGMPKDVTWPANATVIDSGKDWNKRIGYQQLLNDYYGRSAASLIILEKDDRQETAVGFTEIIEVMAMARPIIMTRTGALPTEIDVQKQGCGILVPPEDPAALAEAIQSIARDPKRAEAMGRKGRELVEKYYNIERYAGDLHKLFSTL